MYTTGGKAVAVPGEVKGFYEAWLRYGKVDWAELYLPTIQLLTEGYPVNRHLAAACATHSEVIKESETLRSVIFTYYYIQVINSEQSHQPILSFITGKMISAVFCCPVTFG